MNFKKFFSRENKIRKILDKDGFYIIMFLCVCIVGASAVWVAKSNIDRLATDDIDRNNELETEEWQVGDLGENEFNDQMRDIIIVDSEEEEENQENEAQEEARVEEIAENVEEIPEVTADNEKQGETSRSPSRILVEENQEPQNEAIEEAVPVSSEAQIAMAWPLKGEIGMGYAVETLAYSKTLEHFTTHHGLDIMAEENTPVKAALAGEVIEVLTDSRLGITITIAHEGNLMTRYSNLCTDAMVKVGDIVGQGQTISGVGISAVFESADGPHLHFEVLKDGSNEDPLEYLAQE